MTADIVVPDKIDTPPPETIPLSVGSEKHYCRIFKDYAGSEDGFLAWFHEEICTANPKAPMLVIDVKYNNGELKQVTKKLYFEYPF